MGNVNENLKAHADGSRRQCGSGRANCGACGEHTGTEVNDESLGSNAAYVQRCTDL